MTLDEIEQEYSPTAEARESGCGVIGVGVGLLLFFGLLAVLVLPLGKKLDAQALLTEWMPAGAPDGFEVVSADVLPTRETVLLLRATTASVAPTGASRVADGMNRPEELVLVRYPSNDAAEAKMRGGSNSKQRMSGGMEDPSQELMRWQRERNFAMHLTVDKGEVMWSRWRAAMATERSLREDGTWRESIRVNLSQPNRFLILFAQWPPDTESNPDQLIPILNRIEMQAVAEEVTQST